MGFAESTVFQDVGIVFLGQRGGGCDPIEDRSSFVLELIKFKAPNLRGGVVPPNVFKSDFGARMERASV